MVSHLLFADDSLLFFTATRKSAQEIKDILQLYCRALGQQINMDKSSIHFAKGCQHEVREEIKVILNIENESLNEKYLGMPSDVGSSVNGAFKYLKDRMEASPRMDGIMSIGRRERSTHQIYGTSNPNILDVVLSATEGFMPTLKWAPP